MNPWLQAALSLVTGLLTATGALLGVRFTVKGNDRATSQRDLASQRETEQRELAARRDEWWRQFTWAAELTRDELEANRVTGLQLLSKLSESELAGRDEYLLLDVFQERRLAFLGDDINAEETAAVQLRVSLDAKLGRQTPRHINAIANEASRRREMTIRLQELGLGPNPKFDQFARNLATKVTKEEWRRKRYKDLGLPLDPDLE